LEAKLKRYRELKIELRSIMTLNPRLREFIKCVLEINELLVEGLQAILENQINTAQARNLVDQARAVLVDHEKRISALEAS
jgi:predicted transcriptional regulator